MKKIAYIIGHRNSDDYRLRNLLVVINWLENFKTLLLNYDIDLIIVVVEQDIIPNVSNKINNEQIINIFLYNDKHIYFSWNQKMLH